MNLPPQVIVGAKRPLRPMHVWAIPRLQIAHRVRALALFDIRHVVSQVYLKDPEVQHLRSTLVMRQNLLRMRMGGEGAIRSIIRLKGGRLKSSKTAAALRRNVDDELRRLRMFEKVDLRYEIEPILKLCESLRLYLKQSESALNAVAKQNQPCRRFMEIPGVGPICALLLYSHRRSVSLRSKCGCWTVSWNDASCAAVRPDCRKVADQQDGKSDDSVSPRNGCPLAYPLGR